MQQPQTFDRNLIKLSLAGDQDFFEIKHFLKHYKQSSAHRSDRLYIVRFQASIIGLVRLIPQESGQTKLYWLRGLFIEPQWRHHGLATTLLRFVDNDLRGRFTEFEIQAFPYQHLHDFYRQQGYESINIDELHPALKRLYHNAVQQGKTWLCMAKLIS